MGASGLGSLLVKEGFLTEQDRLTITKTCGQGSWAFAKSILAIGLLDEDELAAFFAERTRYQIAPKDFLNHLDQSAIHALDKRLISKLEVIPLKKDPGKITVGVVDPLDRSTLKQLEFFTGLEVNPVVIPLSQLYEGLVRIDPEFRLQSTALTHFLQNHAQAAWVRQKLETDDIPVEAPARVSRSSGNSSGVEEIYDELPEIEEVEEDEIEEVEEMDEAVEEDESEVDPFAGVGESHDDDLGAEISARSTASSDSDDLLEMVSEEEDEDSPASSSRKAESDELDFDMDLAGSEDDFANKTKPGSDFDSFDDELSESKKDPDSEEEGSFLNPGATEDKPLGDDEAELEASFEANAEANLTVDLAAEAEDDALDFGLGDDLGANETTQAKTKPSDGFDDEPEAGLDESMPDVKASDRGSDILAHDEGEDNFEMEDIAPQSDAGQPMSTFGFEETKPRALAKPVRSDSDILDHLNDREPSLDISALSSDPLDDDLLADLHAEIEADDHTPDLRVDGPNTRERDEPEAFTSAPVSRVKAKEPSFTDEDEDTHIDLRPSLGTKASVHDDDDDILLHPKARTETRDSGLNPTSALNEVMLKLSLCWNAEGVLKVLQGSLYKIGEAGCLINTKSQKQIIWCDGRLITEELGPAALLPMVKAGSMNKWNALDLKASESWAQKPLKLKVYRSGDWLWAHQLKMNVDTGIFRETVESTVSQIADKLGAG